MDCSTAVIIYYVRSKWGPVLVGGGHDGMGDLPDDESAKVSARGETITRDLMGGARETDWRRKN